MTRTVVIMLVDVNMKVKTWTEIWKPKKVLAQVKSIVKFWS